MEAALAENKKLKDRLERLQALQYLMSDPSLGSAATIKRNMDRVDAAKKAFDNYDADGDSAINASELASLAASLGSPLSEVELDAALKMIDTGKDGVIQFAEFFNWWIKSPKSGGKLGSLRSALDSKWLTSLSDSASKFATALSESKSGHTMVNHSFRLGIGASETPAAFIRANLSYADSTPVAGGKAAGAEIRIITTAGSAPALADTLNAMVPPGAIPPFAELKIAAVEGSDEVIVSVTADSPFGDPLSSIAEAGLDLSTYLDKASVALEFKNFVFDLLAPGLTGAPANLLGFLLAFNFSFDSQLIDKAISMGIIPGDTCWVALAESSEFKFELTNLYYMLDSFLNRETLPTLPPMLIEMIRDKALSTETLPGLVAMLPMMLASLPLSRMIPPPILEIATMISDVAGITVQHTTGLTLDVSTRGILRLGQAAEILAGSAAAAGGPPGFGAPIPL